MARAPGDEEFTRFVAARWPSLYRTAYLLLHDHALAEDLVQTALLKTYRSWSKVRAVEAAEAYTRTVMVNTALSWFRRKSWNAERPTEHLPESTALPEDRDTWLLDEIRKLPERQRAVVVLRFHADLSVDETARLLEISPGTVKSQTHHALARLRDVLGPELVAAVEGES